MSLARTAKRKWKAVDPVLRALMISVLVHLIIFGSWKLGEGLGISQKLPLFNLIKKVEQTLLPVPAVVVAPPQQREIKLTFVEVDLSKVAAEEPKDARYQGAVNKEAANPTIKQTNIPKIDGTKKKVPKLTDNSTLKAKPLEPTPIANAEFDEQEKPEIKPKEAQTAGDLTLAKPKEKPVKNDDASATEKEEKAQPIKRRPRTIAEAKAAARPGEKLEQDGGLKRYDLSASFNVKGTEIGGYDQRLIEAVQQCWDDSIEQISAGEPGIVRLEFRINYKGQISDMRVAETTVGEMQTLICQQAILKPAPYGDWPRAMRIELQHDYRDVTFTFHYR